MSTSLNLLGSCWLLFSIVLDVEVHKHDEENNWVEEEKAWHECWEVAASAKSADVVKNAEHELSLGIDKEFLFMKISFFLLS